MQSLGQLRKLSLRLKHPKQSERDDRDFSPKSRDFFVRFALVSSTLVLIRSSLPLRLIDSSCTRLVCAVSFQMWKKNMAI